ncbi:MAG: hypothetical protein ACREX5_02250 [Achromobacter pestifer]
MPIEFDVIEKGFMETVHSHPAFVGWKKRRKRSLWQALGDVSQGVELIRHKASFDNMQWVSLGLFVSVPYERHWPESIDVLSDIWDKGRLYRRAYLIPGRGLTEDPTLGSGAVIKISSPEDLADWLAAMPADIEQFAAPWLQRYQTLEEASYEYKIPRWKLEKAGLIPWRGGHEP